MWTRKRISAVVVAVLVSVAGGVVSAEYLPWVDVEDANEPNYVEGELLVRFAPKQDAMIPTRLERRAILNALGGARETGAYWLVPGLTVVKLPDGVTVEQALAKFNARKDILYAEPNWILRIQFTPDDPGFADQWGLNNTGQTGGTTGADVNAPEAWDLAVGTQEIVVAVIDTGVDYNHPDLAANMWVNEGEIPANNIDDDDNGFIDDVYGYNMIGVDPNTDTGGIPVPDPNHDGDPMDDNGHGTHCAGIIGAASNNDMGVSGVCPNVRIMALKFLGSGGSGDNAHAISCIQYAINNGANIMNNSWGGGGYSSSLKAAIEAAGDAGLPFIAAAGNSKPVGIDNDQYPHYPSSYDCSNIIAVLATDHDDALSGFSNYGETTVDLGAPGSSILSTYSVSPYLLGKYAHKSGTSMACPHVAGACALVWSVNPSLDYSDVKSIIMDSVDEVDSLEGKCVTEGRLNVHRAILSIPAYGSFVALNRQYYSCSDEINIIAGDSELAGDGTTDVNIVTSDGNDLETVTLTETPADSGLFLGSIATSPNSVTADSDYLEVSDGETITVTFSDVNDIATTDCVSPVIVDDIIDFNDAPIGPDIWISFDTNELTVACVRYGTTCGGPYKTQYSKGFSHNIKLLEPYPWADNYFIIEATDLAGNTTTDANCYMFTTDGPEDINVPADFNSIQDAVDAIDEPTWDGWRVIVAPGTYEETVTIDKECTLTSTDPYDSSVVANTIIDANGAGTAVTFPGWTPLDPGLSAYEGPVVTGFTVKSGTMCIACYGGSPTISNCVIELDSSEAYSNVVYCYTSGTATIENCTITGTYYNGTQRGIMCHTSDPIVRNNVINTTGEGIHIYSSGPTIKNNIIRDCETYGIRSYKGGDAVIRNNTIVSNYYAKGISNDYRTAPTISNCILWGNSDDLDNCSATYSCIEDVNDANGVGNISSDPNFIDPENYDYHLASDSPCINAGDPNGDYTGQVDIDGDVRVMCRVDIGADEVECFPSEYSAYADWVAMGQPDCWCYCWPYQCDADADGVVTADANEYRVSQADLDLLNANWKKLIDDPALNPCADFDHKAHSRGYRVYVGDLATLTANWQKTDEELDGDCPRDE